MTTGYSDRINHAFAFAAKHHDTQVRKGTALPYLTRPANVAVILTRYGQAEDTVLAAILHGVVEGSVRDGRKRDAVVRLATAPTAARWVCAADALHSVGTILADLKRTDYPETVWARTSRGREGTIRYYRSVCDRLSE